MASRILSLGMTVSFPPLLSFLPATYPLIESTGWLVFLLAFRCYPLVYFLHYLTLSWPCQMLPLQLHLVWALWVLPPLDLFLFSRGFHSYLLQYAPEIVEGYFHQSPLRVVILSAIHGLNVCLKPVLIGMLGPIGLVVDHIAFTA